MATTLALAPRRWLHRARGLLPLESRVLLLVLGIVAV
jgi:hypothetical protein